ncbi:hypothetical protein [Lonsdalea quercina]
MSARYLKLLLLFIHGADRLKRIIYRLEGEVDELNTVMTR